MRDAPLWCGSCLASSARACRALATAERTATVSLSAITDNPVFLPPRGERPLGAVYSNGGYHNAQAAAAIDGLTYPS